MSKARILTVCTFCGMWIAHQPGCEGVNMSAEKKSSAVFSNTAPETVVKTLQPKQKVEVAPIDKDAVIYIELVDYRHIVIRRKGNRGKLHTVNLHFPKADKAEIFLDEKLTYAKQVGAEIVNEGSKAFRIKGLAGKLVIYDDDRVVVF